MRSTRTAGTIIFLLGVAAGLILAVTSVWADFEAMSYFYTGAGYASFGGLKCPVWMSHAETQTVSAAFDNPGNEEIQPYYEVDISGMAAMRHIENQIQVAAHTSKSVQWTVDANDIDLGSFVMVRMDVLPVADYSTREATCGILVLNLPGLGGGQAEAAALAGSLIGTVVGLALREGQAEAIPGKEMTMRNGLRAAGVAVSLAMLTGLLGWWLIGVLFCAVTILLLMILLRIAVS